MKKKLIEIIIGAVLLVAAILLAENLSIVSLILYIAAFAVSGFVVVRSAFRGIFKGNVFNENTLMVIAAVGAFIIGEYPEAVFVVIFYRVGEMFEDYAVKKSRNSIREVMNICPDYANLVKDGITERVDPDEVSIGDIISVAAGERVPLDGVVVTVPQKGEKARLLALSKLNVKQYRADRLKQEEKLNPEQKATRLMKEIQELLHLEKLPVDKNDILMLYLCVYDFIPSI